MKAKRRMLGKTIVIIAAAMIWSMPAQAVGKGDVAPAWQGNTFQDETVSFPELANGKPTIVIFWATWCSYCKVFMPYLKEIQEEYGDSIEIVAVNSREAEGGDSDPEAYVKQTGIAMTAIRNGEDIAAAYGVKLIPGLMVVGSDGTVAYRRGQTKLPAGKTVAELWSEQVRAVLDEQLMLEMGGC